MNNYWIKVFCVVLSVRLSIQSTLTTAIPSVTPKPPTRVSSLLSAIPTLSPELSKRQTLEMKPTYAAGVVEFAPQGTFQHPPGQLDINLRKYKEIILSDEANHLDIIVFPEYSLNSYETPVAVPPPNQNILACGNESYSYVVQELSCAAAQVGTYVVVSMIIELKCSEEPELLNSACAAAGGYSLYNAAVVFDRSGSVVAIYRKYNLFGDTFIRKPLKADHTTFLTDFGVTFGLIICFDIVLKVPAVDLVNRGIQNFIMPTMWYSELPFDTAIQYQQFWAYAHNVNLLAAGGNIPDDGYTGSGIYSGHNGALNAIVSSVNITKLITAEVPKRPRGVSSEIVAALQEAPRSRDGSLFQPSEIFSSQNLKRLQIQMLNFTDNPKHRGEVCQNDFCCKYEIIAHQRKLPDNLPFYSYAIAVLNGTLSFQPHATVNIHSTICSLVACSNETECEFDFTRAHYEKYQFKQIHLYANFTVNQNITIAPNTLTAHMLPLQRKDYDYSINNETRDTLKTISLQLRVQRSDIFTFSIYSRDYSKDVFSSVSKTVEAFNLLFFSIFLVFISNLSS